MFAARLKPQREKSLLRRHPWVFAGALASLEGGPTPGDTVVVRSAAGEPLGRGAYSPASQIAIRMWTFDPAEEVDAAFLRTRLSQAIARRQELSRGEDIALRLVHAESDGLPGLVIDRYANTLVVQILTAGMDRRRTELIDALAELMPACTIYERSDLDVRFKEGLSPQSGLLRGSEPPEHIGIAEGGRRFLVDVRAGHKTGFYLDQRVNRALLRELCHGREVLNGFAYTGAFTVAALTGGAERVIQIDTSAPALALAARHVTENGFDPGRVESVVGNVFAELRRFRSEGRRFDIVVLDPPKFVESKKHLDTAARGYKDINLLACQLLRPGGLLMTFSCSGLMPADLFQKIVADAALDAGRWGQILGHLGPSPDHPTALSFPEGSYLKGLLCRIE